MVLFLSMLPGTTLNYRQYSCEVYFQCNMCQQILCVNVSGQDIGYELQSLIYENELPSDLHKQDIQTLVAERESVLRRVIADIDSLRIIEAKTRAEIVSLRTLLSPIRRLPAEILLMIFRFFVGPMENEDERETWNRTVESTAFDRTLALSHVCSVWRNTLVQAPSFWSRQQISIEQTRGGLQLDEQTALVSDFLHRALPRLVDLDITISDSCPIGVLKFLQPFARYIRLLRLRGAQQRLFVLSGISEKGSAFSALEAMEVCSSFDGALPEMMRQLEFSPPRLRSLTLDGFAPEEFFTISWSQLTELYIFAMDMDPSPWRDILLQCSANLTSCGLEIDSWDEPLEESEIIPQVFPSMRDLDVHFAGEGRDLAVFQPLFASFSAPSLRSFRMIGKEISTWDVEDLMGFATRSFASLQTLFLSCVPMEAHEVWRLLEQTPNLADLTLQGLYCDEDELFPPLIPSVALSMSRTPLVPRLEGLTIEDSGYLMGDSTRQARRDELLMKFVSERWWVEDDGIATHSTVKLKEVSITFDSEHAVSASVRSHFDEYRAQGLIVDVEA